MSLLSKEVVVEHDPNEVNADLLVDKMDNMGFKAVVKSGYRDLVIFIEGMTCMSCVRNIEGVMSTKNGVLFVKVSLDNKLGYFKYDPKVTSPEVMCDAVNDMGFDALLTSPTTGLLAETTDIHVKGMTCQSCVKHIQGVVSDLAGVSHISVSLDDELATVEFDPSLTNAQKICNAIDDVGFEATLPQAATNPGSHTEGSSCKDITNNKMVKINVEGMTCNSCVQHIQGVVSQKSGVESINVSLETKSASISYNPMKTSPQELCTAIDDMGFEAVLSESSTADGFDELALRGGMGDQTAGHVCVIAVDGMTCMSCVRHIEDIVAEMTGVCSVHVSLRDNSATVQLRPGAVSPQEVAARIDDMGFETRVVERASGDCVSMQNASISNNSALWKRRNLHRATLTITGLHSNSCVVRIEEKVLAMSGVEYVSGSLMNDSCDVIYDANFVTFKNLCNTIEDCGYQARLKGRCSCAGNLIYDWFVLFYPCIGGTVLP